MDILVLSSYSISSLGSTALFDAISSAFDALSERPTSNDWIVCLTDGQDTGSRVSHSILRARLQSKAKAVGLVMIGVGGDVREQELRQLAEATSKGMIHVL